MIKKIEWWVEPHRAGVTIVANATVEIAGKTERFMIFREVGRYERFMIFREVGRYERFMIFREVGRYELFTTRCLSWLVGRNIERMTRELRHRIAFEGHTL